MRPLEEIMKWGDNETWLDYLDRIVIESQHLWARRVMTPDGLIPVEEAKQLESGRYVKR